MLGEGFGAVTALQQKGLALRNLGEFRGQVARFAGKNERRKARERVRRAGQCRGVGIVGKLAGFGAGPAVGGPVRGHNVVLRGVNVAAHAPKTDFAQ
ncbi:hypothetical protein WR25_18311 [Diploscapter pachys]|uniref:Uncharacterized protein n=1 Tax=Diploscapter pachys TaxID=2018661 RepID=A0A2A2M2F6_9BILA|nr:hypothetical protein WR25_18311 [Diploscapter pachys]